MKRIVQPEWLDILPPGDRRAIRSRRDLRRVNACMGNPQIMAAALRGMLDSRLREKITELGAGDGKFLLSVAQRTSPRWPGAKATLLDLQNNVSAETLAEFTATGWQAEVLVTDVFDWPKNSDGRGVVIANLFLHHFEDARLAELLRLIAQRAELFIAIEPERAAWPLFCSRLLWGIGCNDVTRHDAVISVRAGFAGNDLSKLWPDQSKWRLTEERAGTFSHLFTARKIH